MSSSRPRKRINSRRIRSGNARTGLARRSHRAQSGFGVEPTMSMKRIVARARSGSDVVPSRVASQTSSIGRRSSRTRRVIPRRDGRLPASSTTACRRDARRQVPCRVDRHDDRRFGGGQGRDPDRRQDRAAMSLSAVIRCTAASGSRDSRRARSRVAYLRRNSFVVRPADRRHEALASSRGPSSPSASRCRPSGRKSSSVRRPRVVGCADPGARQRDAVQDEPLRPLGVRRGEQRRHRAALRR